MSTSAVLQRVRSNWKPENMKPEIFSRQQFRRAVIKNTKLMVADEKRERLAERRSRRGKGE